MVELLEKERISELFLFPSNFKYLYSFPTFLLFLKVRFNQLNKIWAAFRKRNLPSDIKIGEASFLVPVFGYESGFSRTRYFNTRKLFNLPLQICHGLGAFNSSESRNFARLTLQKSRRNLVSFIQNKATPNEVHTPCRCQKFRFTEIRNTPRQGCIILISYPFAGWLTFRENNFFF